MNGLKTVRIQCNYSVGAAAEAAGIDEEYLAMLEEDDSVIPEDIRMQFAKSYGIDGSFLTDLTEEARQRLEEMPIFLKNDSTDEHYTYSSRDAVREWNGRVLAIKEPLRNSTFNDEYAYRINLRAELSDKLNRLFASPLAKNPMGRMLNINRQTILYSELVDSVEMVFSGKLDKTMEKYHILVDAIAGVRERLADTENEGEANHIFNWADEDEDDRAAIWIELIDPEGT